MKDNEISIDLVFSKKEKSKKMKYFLLALFDEFLPRYRVKNCIRKYKDFYFSNEWEDIIRVKFPIILLLFETKGKMIYAKRYIKRLFEEEGEENIPMNFATVDDIKKYGVTGKVWERI